MGPSKVKRWNPSSVSEVVGVVLGRTLACEACSDPALMAAELSWKSVWRPKLDTLTLKRLVSSEERVHSFKKTLLRSPLPPRAHSEQPYSVLMWPRLGSHLLELSHFF